MKGLKLSLKNGKIKATIKKADLILSDTAQSNMFCGTKYNHPFIKIYLEEKPDCWPSSDFFYINAQRHTPRADDSHNLAVNAMDTCLPWSSTYAAHICMDSDSTEIKFSTNGHKILAFDQLKIAFAKKIANAIEKYNIRFKHPTCELSQVAGALRCLGVDVYEKYLPEGEHNPDKAVWLHEIENRYANHKLKKAVND